MIGVEEHPLANERGAPGKRAPPWTPIFTCWVAPAACLGALVGLELALSNRHMGAGRDELFVIGYVNALAVVGPALLAGACVALLIPLLLRVSPILREPAGRLRVHAALAAGVLLGWTLFGPTNQSDWEPGTRFRLRALVCAAGVLTALVVYVLFPRLGRMRFLRGMARLASAAALLALAASSLHLAAIAVAGDGAASAGSASPAPLAADRTDRGTLIVIGIDALDWTLLRPLIQSGEAKNLARLERLGTSAVLETQVPTESPRIWNTVVTSRSPEDHGIAEFQVTQFPALGIRRLFRTRSLNYTGWMLELVADGWRKPVSSAERLVPALWDLCSAAGIPVGVTAWWASWPADPVAGFQISDHSFYPTLAEEDWRRNVPVLASHGLTHPPELQAELMASHGKAQVVPEVLERYVQLTDGERAQLGELVRADPTLKTLLLAVQKDSYYGNAALELFDRFQPRVLLAYFNAVDSFAHVVYAHGAPEAAQRGHADEQVRRYAGSMRAVALATDDWVGRFLERMDADTTVAVLSDHGFCREFGTYGHKTGPPGILILAGKNVASGARAHDPIRVDDVAPTLLHLAGLPLSDEASGRLLTELLDPGFLAAHPPRHVPTYGPRSSGGSSPSSSPEDERMLDHLRALGYVR